MGIELPVENNHLVVENGAILTSLVPDYPLVVDDFEDQDLTEYSGATSEFSIVSGGQNGSYCLEKNTGSHNYLRSTSGLDNYPAIGDIFKVWIYCTNYQIEFEFGGDGSGNNYTVFIAPDTDDLEISKNDRSSLIGICHPSIFYNTWYEAKVEWGNDDSITVTLYDSEGSQLTDGTVTGTDSEYSNQTGICFKGYATNNKWDYYRITGST